MIRVANTSNFVHLFDYPLCDQQPIFQRIANICFHIFTLFIPLTFYVIYMCARPQPAPTFNPDDCACCIKAPFLNSVASEQARGIRLKMADILLRREPSIVPVVYDCGDSHTIQPTDPKISKLMALSNNKVSILWPNIFSLDQYQVREDSIDKLMTIRYAISVLALEEIPKETVIETLKNDNSHLILNFFHFSKFYHRVRGQVLYNKETNSVYYPEKISEVIEASFYTKGTLQNNWRLMYNDYCYRVRGLISEKDLRNASLNHHAAWTQPDLSPSTFRRVPGLLPGVETW